MWKEMVKYPNHLDKKTQEILDILDELLGNSCCTESKYTYMADLLREGKKAGLITSKERWTIRSKIAPNM